MTKPTRSIYTDPEPVFEPWPAPEIDCRPATEAETCTAAQRLHKTALANGWAVNVTYARGTKTKATKSRPARIVDSIAVRCRRGDDYAVAVWIDGKFDVAYGINPLERLSSVALKERLTS